MPQNRQNINKEQLEIKGELSTHIKDAGIAIRNSRGFSLSLLQGLEMRSEGVGIRGTQSKYLQRNMFLVPVERRVAPIVWGDNINNEANCHSEKCVMKTFTNTNQFGCKTSPSDPTI